MLIKITSIGVGLIDHRAKTIGVLCQFSSTIVLGSSYVSLPRNCETFRLFPSGRTLGSNDRVIYPANRSQSGRLDFNRGCDGNLKAGAQSQETTIKGPVVAECNSENKKTS